jgi:alpha-tubulin suppressor-like RCC1 family protein
VAEVRTGDNYTCALDVTGAVKCWGGSGGNGQGFAVPNPRPVPGMSSGVAHIACGGDFTCALTSAGGLKCWGTNGAGQLGNGTTTDSLTAAVDVTGLTSGVQAVAASGEYTIGGDQNFACALTTAGGVKCWGYNGGYQLGDGTFTERNTPVDVNGLASGVSAICVGYDYGCAIVGGGVKCWGHMSNLAQGALVDISNVTGATSLGCGEAHACAVMGGGAVACWGDDNRGQLGNGVETFGTTLSAVTPTGLAPAVGVVASDMTTCAWTAGGAAFCWGDGSEGAVGNGATSNADVPAGVSGLGTGVKQVAGAAQSSHVCAVVSGGVQCWGWNNAGQLGDGTNNQSNTPVVVGGL